MATVTPDKLKDDVYVAVGSATAGHQDTTTWYRIDWDVSTATETTPIFIGKNKCVIITLGTVGTTVVGGSGEAFVLEASNPDGTFSDMGLSGFTVSTSDAMPAQQIFDCPQVIRLTGTGATTGVFNLWIEVQR